MASDVPAVHSEASSHSPPSDRSALSPASSSPSALSLSAIDGAASDPSASARRPSSSAASTLAPSPRSSPLPGNVADSTSLQPDPIDSPFSSPRSTAESLAGSSAGLDLDADGPSLIPLQHHGFGSPPSTLLRRRRPEQGSGTKDTFPGSCESQSFRDRRDTGNSSNPLASDLRSSVYSQVSPFLSHSLNTPTAASSSDTLAPNNAASTNTCRNFVEPARSSQGLLRRLRFMQHTNPHNGSDMTSDALSWAAKHKRLVAVVLLSMIVSFQVFFVGPYVSQSDTLQKLKSAEWQWPALSPDRHTGSLPAGGLGETLYPSDGGGAKDGVQDASHKASGSTPDDLQEQPQQQKQQQKQPSISGLGHWQLTTVNAASFPAPIDKGAWGGKAALAGDHYKDVDPHRGELPTHLRSILEKDPPLSYVPWPPKAPEITTEMWPRDSWDARSTTDPADANHPEQQPNEEDWRSAPWAGWQPPLDNFTASAATSPLPRVQFSFQDASKHSGQSNEPDRDATLRYRQKLVRNAFLHAWEGYKKYAWGHDELRPVSKQPQDPFNGWGATIVDALDTLLVMGLPDQYDLARQHVRDIDFRLVGGDRSAYGAADGRIPVFETAIRYLGGFLSAYDLSGDTLMRDRAEELAQLIMPAFETATGVPVGRIRMVKNDDDPRPFAPPHSQGSVILAEAGSLLLEFTRLWQVTGNRTYYDRVQRSTDYLDRNMTEGRLGSLFPPTLFPERQSSFGTYAFGGMADSYYEYLIKEHQLLGGRLTQYARMYSDSIESAKTHLIRSVDTVPGVKLLNIGEQSALRYTAKLEHLTCFSGGMLGLGSKLLRERKDDLVLATAYAASCWWAYNSTATGLGPENVVFYGSDDPSRYEMIHLEDGTQRRGRARGNPIVGVQSSAGMYLNRPETIESVFYMWRITGDPQWQERGWQMFTSWVYHAMTDAGFSAIRSVHALPAAWADSMESFTFAETFKYYYLLFSPPELISLDEYVFTTEAHPLLVPQNGRWAVAGHGSKEFWKPGSEGSHLPAPTSGIYPGGEGKQYGGLTNNQKHLIHKQWQKKHAKLLARSLIDSLGTESLKAKFRGLLNSVDWDGFGRNWAVSPATVPSEAEMDEEPARTTTAIDKGVDTDGLDDPNPAFASDALAKTKLVTLEDGSVVLQLDPEGDVEEQAALLRVFGLDLSDAAGDEDQTIADWAGGQQILVPIAGPTASAMHRDAEEDRLRVESEEAGGQDEEAAQARAEAERMEVKRLGDLQAARFRAKGLVG